MSTFDDASLVFIPSGYKTSKAYSVKPIDGTGDLAFTRSNSTATRVGPNGLIEKVRTNLLLQSNTFSTTWTASNASVTSGQAGYDGTNNAWLLSKSAANGYISQGPASSGSETISVYAKAGTDNWLHILVRDSASVFFGGYWDLQNGVVGSAIGATTLRIESIGNGWYRCSASFVKSTSNYYRIYPAEGNNDTSGTSGNILIQAAQLETGDIATQPILTTTAAVSVGPVANVPRLDYLNSSCPRLLLEPQRTNVIQNSENLSAASWTKTSCTISANAGAAPDGTTTADKVIMNNGLSPTSAGADGVYQVSLITSGVYSVSFFAKSAEFTSVNVRDNAVTGAFLNINLTNGVVTNPAPSQFVGAQAVNYGNGWYRVSFTTATIVATQAFSIRAGQTGDGTSGFLLWGVQYELGAYATSYIPTLGAAVTRGADACSKTGISSLIGQTQGTLFAEATLNRTGVSQNIELGDGTANNRIDLRLNSNNNYQLVIVQGGVVVFNQISSATFAQGETVKIAAAYKSGDSTVVYVNGVAVAGGTAGTITGSLSAIFNGSTGGTLDPMNSPIKQLLVFKTRLSNSDLAALTTL